MQKILVPVDGSINALRALDYVIRFKKNSLPNIEVIIANIQAPIHSSHGRLFVSESDLAIYYKEESEACLLDAKKMLDEQQVNYMEVRKVGPIAETIVHVADEYECDTIVMGTRGLGKVKNIVLGSVSTKVVSLSNVPVVLVK